jgi:hypothetical protein
VKIEKIEWNLYMTDVRTHQAASHLWAATSRLLRAPVRRPPATSWHITRVKNPKLYYKTVAASLEVLQVIYTPHCIYHPQTLSTSYIFVLLRCSLFAHV